MKKAASIILLLAAILSIFAALITISFICSTLPSSTSMEGLYHTTHHMWMFWIFMLIPLTCLAFGVLKKQKKNLIIGIIFSCLMLLFGCFYFINLSQYSTDTAYVEKLAQELQIELPNEYSVITQDHTGGTQTTSDGTYMKYDSVARISGDSASFASGLGSDKWKTNKNDINDIIPTLTSLTTGNCEYFLLYCYETKSFSDEVAVSGYNYVYIAFDTDNAVLYIAEFTRK